MASDSAVPSPHDRLFPRPRVLDELRSGSVDSGAPLTARQDSALPAQGYELVVDAGQLQLSFADEAGRRYGEQAVSQLRSSGDPIPALRIRDWPDFPIRGYFLDISRNRVPTRQSLARTVEILAACRFNLFQLYIEHTFAYSGHETVWGEASPLTGADLQWLDALCRDHGIELTVNQNCFGHMERWLKHPAYNARAEAPDGWRSRFGGLIPPAVLAPTTDNAEFAIGLVREIERHVASRRINIGCDETFELGKGHSEAAVAERGRGRVYFDHLLRLIEPLRQDGFDVQFWGDILQHHPDLVRELPRERLTALVWHYEAPIDRKLVPDFVVEALAEFGVTETVLDGFSPQVEAFRSNGFPHWVCPGTSSWNSIAGRLGNATINMREAAESGRASGAGGYLITEWGDNGHLQAPVAGHAALVYGAGLAWCGDANRDVDPAGVLDRWIYGDAQAQLGTVAVELGGLYARTGKHGFNGSPIFTALTQKSLLGGLGAADADSLAGVQATLEDCWARIAAAQPACSDGPIVRREWQQAVRLLRHGAWRLAREIDAPRPSDTELKRDLSELIEEQRACWLLRSRPGGLPESLARLEATLATY